jgi:hypothetical protein
MLRIVTISVAVFILVAGVGLYVCLTELAPDSANEDLFRSRLSKYAAEGKAEIPLTDLASFDWEMVCENHPYDGGWLYLEKYGRTYEAPESSAHKGVWVLLFVAADGSGTHVTGGCRHGGARIYSNTGCLDRKVASLRLRRTGECPEYEAVRGENIPKTVTVEP